MSYITDPFDKRKHKRELFDCLDHVLNHYLKRILSQDIAKNLGTGYVCTDENNEIIGYYTLQNTVVFSRDYTSETTKKVGYSEVPSFLIGRLGIHWEHQGKGLGAKILRDALIRCFEYKSYSGGHYVVVDASSEKAKAFYERYGFVSTERDPMRLLIPMKSIQRFIT